MTPEPRIMTPQQTLQASPFGTWLLGRCQLNDLEILFRFSNAMGSHPVAQQFLQNIYTWQRYKLRRQLEFVTETQAP